MGGQALLSRHPTAAGTRAGVSGWAASGERGGVSLAAECEAPEVRFCNVRSMSVLQRYISDTSVMSMYLVRTEIKEESLETHS